MEQMLIRLRVLTRFVRMSGDHKGENQQSKNYNQRQMILILQSDNKF